MKSLSTGVFHLYFGLLMVCSLVTCRVDGGDAPFILITASLNRSSFYFVKIRTRTLVHPSSWVKFVGRLELRCWFHSMQDSMM